MKSFFQTIHEAKTTNQQLEDLLWDKHRTQISLNLAAYNSGDAPPDEQVYAKLADTLWNHIQFGSNKLHDPDSPLSAKQQFNTVLPMYSTHYWSKFDTHPPKTPEEFVTKSEEIRKKVQHANDTLKEMIFSKIRPPILPHRKYMDSALRIITPSFLYYDAGPHNVPNIISKFRDYDLLAKHRKLSPATTVATSYGQDSSHIPETDFRQLTRRALSDILQNHANDLDMLKNPPGPGKLTRGVDYHLMHEDDDVQVFRPLNYDANVQLSRSFTSGFRAGWCTSKYSPDQYYNEYTSKGPLTIFHPKKPLYPNEMYLLHTTPNGYGHHSGYQLKTELNTPVDMRHDHAAAFHSPEDEQKYRQILNNINDPRYGFVNQFAFLKQRFPGLPHMFTKPEGTYIKVEPNQYPT